MIHLALISRRTLARFAAAAVAAATLPAQGAQVLWSNPWSNAATVSSIVATTPATDVEAADDFDVQGTITRIVIDGTGCSSCTPPVVAGATVRFYQWNQGAVGALQHQQFVAAGTPALAYTPVEPQTLDIALPQPFVATGRHFLSVQLHFTGGGYWSVWVGNWGNPSLSGVLVRDRNGTNAWTTPTIHPWPSPQVIGDLTFRLEGFPPGVTTLPAQHCATWSPTALDAPAGSTHSLLTDVTMFQVDDVWAVGRTTRPVVGGTAVESTVMHWDGSAWARVPSPSPSVGTAAPSVWLEAIGGTSANDLWVAGSYQTQVNGGWYGPQVFAMHWDGQGWTIPALPVPNTSLGAGITGSGIDDLVAIASNDVWFVGDWLDLLSAANPVTLRPGLLLHWDGGSLQQTILPIVTGVGHQYFNAVAAFAANDVWVVGGAGMAGNLPGSPTPVVFHFDGSNWTHRPCPVPPGNINCYDVEVTLANDVFVFGTATDTSTPLPTTTRFMAHWNGANWTLLPGPPAGLDCRAFSPTEIWSVGNAVHRWNGASWTLEHDFAANGGGSLSAVDAFAPCILAGVGGRSQNGQVVPFAARQDHDQLWRTRTRLALLPDRAPAVLEAGSAVRLGGALRVAIDDPGGALPGATASTFWLLAVQPAPPGTTLGFGGRNGGPGEVLVDPSTIGHVAGPVQFQRGAGPAVHTIAIPTNSGLVGMDLRTQALLVDGSPPFGVAFTNALDLHVGY